GEAVPWDGGFIGAVAPANGGARPASSTVKVLGAAGWAAVTAARPDLRKHALPPPVRPVLPALWDGARVACVPHLGYCRKDVKVRVSAVLAPDLSLAPAGCAGA